MMEKTVFSKKLRLLLKEVELSMRTALLLLCPSPRQGRLGGVLFVPDTFGCFTIDLFWGVPYAMLAGKVLTRFVFVDDGV